MTVEKVWIGMPKSEPDAPALCVNGDLMEANIPITEEYVEPVISANK